MSHRHKATTKPSSKHTNEDGTRRIHFLSALASVPVPFQLLTGMPIHTVSANGKTQPATFTFSVDHFTAYIRHDNASSGGGRGLARTGSEKSLGTSSFFSLNFRDTPKIEQRAIDIGEMDRVQRGQSTQQFEFAKKHVKAADLIANKTGTEVVYKKAELRTAIPAPIPILPYPLRRLPLPLLYRLIPPFRSALYSEGLIHLI